MTEARSDAVNSGVGCHFLLQGIFPIQGLNPCLLHWQEDSLPLRHLGNLIYQYISESFCYSPETNINQLYSNKKMCWVKKNKNSYGHLLNWPTRQSFKKHLRYETKRPSPDPPHTPALPPDSSESPSTAGEDGKRSHGSCPQRALRASDEPPHRYRGSHVSSGTLVNMEAEEVPFL